MAVGFFARRNLPVARLRSGCTRNEKRDSAVASLGYNIRGRIPQRILII
jgi:hypothetical protein